MHMRNRGNRAGRGARWRNRDLRIAGGRLLIAVIAVFGIGYMGWGADVAPSSPQPDQTYIVRPATEVEKLTHDLKHEFEMDAYRGWRP